MNKPQRVRIGRHLPYGWWCSSRFGYLWHDGTWRGSALHEGNPSTDRNRLSGWFLSRKEIEDTLLAMYGAGHGIQLRRAH